MDQPSGTTFKEGAIQFTVFLLRVVAGFLFIQVGGAKLFGWFNVLPPGPLPPLLQVAGYLEFYGGILILLGLFTHFVAFVLSGEMAVAYFMGHFEKEMGRPKPDAFWPIQNHGEPAVLLCFIFLFLAAYGAGKWSVDGLILGKKSAPN